MAICGGQSGVRAKEAKDFLVQETAEQAALDVNWQYSQLVEFGSNAGKLGIGHGVK